MGDTKTMQLTVDIVPESLKQPISTMRCNLVKSLSSRSTRPLSLGPHAMWLTSVWPTQVLADVRVTLTRRCANIAALGLADSRERFS